MPEARPGPGVTRCSAVCADLGDGGRGCSLFSSRFSELFHVTPMHFHVLFGSQSPGLAVLSTGLSLLHKAFSTVAGPAQDTPPSRPEPGSPPHTRPGPGHSPTRTLTLTHPHAPSHVHTHTQPHAHSPTHTHAHSPPYSRTHAHIPTHAHSVCTAMFTCIYSHTHSHSRTHAHSDPLPHPSRAPSCRSPRASALGPLPPHDSPAFLSLARTRAPSDKHTEHAYDCTHRPPGGSFCFGGLFIPKALAQRGTAGARPVPHWLRPGAPPALPGRRPRVRSGKCMCARTCACAALCVHVRVCTCVSVCITWGYTHV